VFTQAAKGVVQKAVEGVHGTIFAYGQTSSGKTHTMKGTTEQPGVIPLALTELFAAIRLEQNRQFLVRVAYLEVYNETVNDLLEAPNQNLEIRESLERGTFVQGLTELPVASEDEALHLLFRGESNRKVGETSMNEQSSRSHTLFKVQVESTPHVDSELSPVRLSYLNLVDLAGSEGVQKTRAEDMRQREGSNINKSLLSLSSVIQKLSEAQVKGVKTYVNFRDSKMTRLLQTSLSGNSKTLIICTVTQSLRHVSETTNTLNFGLSAKRIKLSVRPNEVVTTESQLRLAQDEIRRMRVSLEEAEARVGEQEADLQRMQQMECDKDQYYQDLHAKLATENEELRHQVVRAQERIEALSRNIMNSADRNLLATPQSARKTVPLSPEASIHSLEALIVEKDRKIHALESNLQRLNEQYEDQYQSLLMDNEHLRGFVEHANSPKFELSEKLAQLTVELEDKARERAEIEEIAKDYEAQLSALKQQLVESASLRQQDLSKIQALADELATTASRKTQIEQALLQVSEKDKFLEQLAEELTAENDKLRQDFSEARVSLAELYQQLEQVVNENDTLKRTQEEVAIASFANERDQHSSEMNQIVSERDQLAKENNNLAAELEFSRKQLAEEKQHLVDIRSSFAAERALILEDQEVLRKEVLKFREEDLHTALEIQRQEAEDLLKTLQAQKEMIKGRCEEAEHQRIRAETSEQRAEDLESRIMSMQVQTDGEELSSVREQLSSVLEESRNLKSELLESRQTLRLQEDQVTELKLASLRSVEWESRAQEAEGRLSRLEADLREAAIEVQRRSSAQKREHTEELHALQQALERAETELRETQSKLERKEAEIEELNRRLQFKRLPSDLLDERCKAELTASERYQFQVQVQSGVNKVKELERFSQMLETKLQRATSDLELKRMQEQNAQTRVRELERKVLRLEEDKTELQLKLGRSTPCELMPRRVERFATPKSQVRDDEEEVDLDSGLRDKCNQQ
jgi:centromeric protein E